MSDEKPLTEEEANRLALEGAAKLRAEYREQARRDAEEIGCQDCESLRHEVKRLREAYEAAEDYLIVMNGDTRNAKQKFERLEKARAALNKEAKGA